MAKKTERQRLIEKLDYVFQMCIRYRDNFKCITCGKQYPRGERTELHAGHYFSRGNYSTRWDEENCNAQCKSCNGKQNWGDAWTWHRYETELKLKYGDDVIDRLHAKKNQVFKYNKGWMLDQIAFYTEALKKYQEK